MADPEAMTNVRHAPVIVVGAGPAGTVVALELALRGIESIVLERDAGVGLHVVGHDPGTDPAPVQLDAHHVADARVHALGGEVVELLVDGGHVRQDAHHAPCRSAHRGLRGRGRS